MKICTFLHFLANLPLCFMSPLTTILTFHKQVWWEESRCGFHKPVDYHTAPDRDVANEQQDIYLMCYRWFHVKFLLPSMKSTWLVCGQLTPESAVNSQGKYNSITQSPFSISPPPMSPLPSPPSNHPLPHNTVNTVYEYGSWMLQFCEQVKVHVLKNYHHHRSIMTNKEKNNNFILTS